MSTAGGRWSEKLIVQRSTEGEMLFASKSNVGNRKAGTLQENERFLVYTAFKKP